MKTPLKILHLEDLESDAALVERILKKWNTLFQKLVVDNKTDFNNALRDFLPDIILSDHSLPSFNSIEALKIVRNSGYNIPFILVTATVSEEFAVTVLKQGADDYILKDNMSRLPSAIEHAIDIYEHRNAKLKSEEKLKSAHDRLLFHLENSPLGYIEWDNQLKVKVWSERAKEIFGWTFEEYRQKQRDGYSEVYIEDQPKMFKIAQQLINGEIERNNVVHRNYKKDGSIIWCEWFNSVLKNEEGNVETIMSLVQDITEQKNTEIRLKENEEKYRTIFYKSPLPKWIFDCETLKFLEVNDEAVRHYGYTHEEFLKMTIKDIRPKEDIGLLLDDLYIIKNGSDSRHGVWRHLKKNGELIIVETTAHFIDYNNRKARMVVSHDITERTKAAAALVKNELRFREFFETAPEAVLVLDPVSRKFVDYNDNALKLLKRSKEEVLGRSPADFSPAYQADGKKSIDKIKEMDKAALEGKLPVFDWIVIDKKGKEIFCEIRLTLLTKTDRPLIRASILDVTDRINLERKLADEKTNKQVEITDAIIIAQEQERAFLGEELHDNINQILATSKLYLDFSVSDGEVRRDKVITGRNYVMDAMEEIRKLSKSFIAPSLGEISLEKAIAEMLTNIQQVHQLQFIKEWKNVEEGKMSEKLKLTIFRIVQEQLNNILKHANAKKVWIKLIQKSGLLQLIIKDNGVGFDTSTKRDGVGLKNIASRTSLFKGTAILKSKPGKGCELDIKFITGTS